MYSGAPVMPRVRFTTDGKSDAYNSVFTVFENPFIYTFPNFYWEGRQSGWELPNSASDIANIPEWELV